MGGGPAHLPTVMRSGFFRDPPLMVLRADETDVGSDSGRMFENDDPGIKERGISKFGPSARNRQFSLCLCLRSLRVAQGEAGGETTAGSYWTRARGPVVVSEVAAN